MYLHNESLSKILRVRSFGQPLVIESWISQNFHNQSWVWDPGFGICKLNILLHVPYQFSSVQSLSHVRHSLQPHGLQHHQLPEFTQTHVHGVSDANSNILCTIVDDLRRKPAERVYQVALGMESALSVIEWLEILLTFHLVSSCDHGFMDKRE